MSIKMFITQEFVSTQNRHDVDDVIIG